ncbi:Nucleolar protein 4-like [Liparis tanakae]|uniref:Nucleolar protein 4-like n=1 Tax=Liparis tanakae TaxID=230148 RepID=A0A4Z2I6B4_9TELE|nr:Nucleolar protein 4-like [Liparis tanakae]
MHVEMGADLGRAPKHAGQKKTYKAVENDRPTSLVPDLIDYNMPLTATYLKQMKLQCMTATERLHIRASLPVSRSFCPQDDSSVSSEDMNGVEPTWVAAEPPPVPEPSPPHGERVSNPTAPIKEEDDDVSSESGSANGLPALTSPEALAVGGNPPDGGAPYGEVTENGLSAPLDFSTTSPSSTSEDQQPVNLSDRLLPAGSSSPNPYPADPNRKYPIKTEYSNKMFVRLFVDENLDRMVPISKQPKEKIQAIIESCSRQFPEFQERSRKRIRTYLKSCRRMKKGGFEIRPTPPHLTSAMAENILAAACDNETRNAAKRIRLDVYQADEPDSVDKSNSRDPASVAPSGFTISSAAFAQDQLYTNGGLNYNPRGYGTVGSNQQNSGAAHTNGPTDLSMKSVGPNSTTSSSNSHGQGGGGGGASAQLSPPEVTAVRQLIAGYRESAAFLLRSADELENLILQQN